MLIVILPELTGLTCEEIMPAINVNFSIAEQEILAAIYPDEGSDLRDAIKESIMRVAWETLDAAAEEWVRGEYANSVPVGNLPNPLDKTATQVAYRASPAYESAPARKARLGN